MLGLMHIRHEMVQESVLLLGPLGDLASQVVDASACSAVQLIRHFTGQT